MYRNLLKDGYGIEEVDSWDAHFFFSVMDLIEEDEPENSNNQPQLARFEDVF